MKIARPALEATKPMLIKRGLYPDDGAVGEVRWTNSWCQHKSIYYPLAQCHPITPEEAEKIREERRAAQREAYRQRQETKRQARAWQEENAAGLEKAFQDTAAYTAKKIPHGACLVDVLLGDGHTTLHYFADDSVCVGEKVLIRYLYDTYGHGWDLHTTVGTVVYRMTRKDLAADGIFCHDDPFQSAHPLVWICAKDNPYHCADGYSGYEVCVAHYYPDGMRWASPIFGPPKPDGGF